MQRKRQGGKPQWAFTCLSALLPLTLGAATAPAPFLVDDATPLAFQQALPGLSSTELQQFGEGRGLFNRLWVAAPSLEPTLDGLGPTFNQSGCAACHLRTGRGKAPAGPNERLRGLLVRLSVPSGAAAVPHPIYGDQLQESAILGVPAEGRVVVSWQDEPRTLADGSVVTLRRPTLQLTRLAFGDIGEVLMSPRVAPQVVGAGLLDAVADATLEQLAATSRPDGISGRVNHLPEGLGRFGWKANMASLRQQTAGAFAGDLGITSSLHPTENCPTAQSACGATPFDTPDLNDEQLDAVVFYQGALAVPAPRHQDEAQVVQGRALFSAAGCQHCHLPELQSGATAALPVLANQRFAAYTDLLLHDMGEGLADGRPDHEADGREWRTPPLWGLGLVPVVNEHHELLHDGRARSVLEAVLWHEGEGAAAAQRVAAMNAAEREALAAFVLSL
jgi:CxxC motif-containing protein (DUF1111 family)